MLRVVILICASLGILFGIMMTSWIVIRKPSNVKANELIKVINSKSKLFLKEEYKLILIFSFLLAIVLFFTVDKIGAIVYFIAVIFSILAITACSISTAGASVNSADMANTLRMDKALRTAYRSGTSVAFLTGGFALLLYGILFATLEINSIFNITVLIALASVIVSLFIKITGNVLSDSRVSSDLNNDLISTVSCNTYNIFGVAAENFDLYVCGISCLIVLADFGVRTSAITSTFTHNATALYPLVICSIGILSSIISSMFYRGHYRRSPAGGLIFANIVNAVILIAGSIYASIHMLDSYAYSFPIAIGIFVSIIISAYTKIYAYNRPIYNKNKNNSRLNEADNEAINGIGIGLFSTLFPTFITVVALAASYYFMNIYGIVLCAIGLVSISGTYNASFVENKVINSAEAIIKDGNYVNKNEYEDDVLKAFDKSLHHTSSEARGSYYALNVFIALSIFLAIKEKSNIEDINILKPSIIIAIIVGVVIPLIIVALNINAVNKAYYNRSDESGFDTIDDMEIIHKAVKSSIEIAFISILYPLVAGVLFGMEFMISSVGIATVVAMMLSYSFSNSGKKFNNISITNTMTSIRIILIVALVFSTYFADFAGFFL